MIASFIAGGIIVAVVIPSVVIASVIVVAPSASASPACNEQYNENAKDDLVE
jgi:hypothetical protein